jgi:hypothetical protein
VVGIAAAALVLAGAALYLILAQQRAPRPMLAHGEVAYVADSSLYIRNLAGGAPRRLVHGKVRYFAWAPGGTRLAVLRRGKLLVVNYPSGGSSKVGAADWFAWSNADALALAAPGGGLSVARPSGGAWQVHRVSATARSAVWSPRGGRLAFVPHGGGVAVYTLAGGARRVFLAGVGVTASYAGREQLFWAPDGRELALVEPWGRKTVPPGYALALLSLSTGLSRVLLPQAKGNLVLAGWWPGGGRDAPLDKRLWVLSHHGVESRVVAGGSGTSALYPAWSPFARGRRLACLSMPSGPYDYPRLVTATSQFRWSVALVGADGKGRRQLLTPRDGSFQWVRLTSGGRHLLVVERRKGRFGGYGAGASSLGGARLLLVRAKTGRAVPLAQSLGLRRIPPQLGLTERGMLRNWPVGYYGQVSWRGLVALRPRPQRRTKRI